MIEINLVPDVKQELIKAQQVRSTVISSAVVISLIAIAIAALLAIYVFAVQTVRSALDDDAITKGSAKLAQVEDLSKVLTIQNQLTKISLLNDQKKVDSRIFDVLTAIIPASPNEVQISHLGIDAATGTITLEGQAKNSYEALNIFKKTISGADIKYTDEQNQSQQIGLASNISTSDVSFGEDSSGVRTLRFTLSFTYAEELFSPLTKNLSIVITNQGNVTDSYLGVPQSIFVDRAKDTEAN